MQKILFTGLLILLTVTLSSQPRPIVDILCYHAFNNRKNQFCTDLPTLERDLKYFKSRGYSFVSLKDLKENRVWGKKNILISVDDGHVSVYKAYFQIFKKYKIKPLLAIYPSVIGRKNYALSWKQLKKLSDSGCDIAAHGYYHRFINSKLFRKEKKAFYREIYQSKKRIENKLNIKIDTFVFPFGARSEITLKHLKKAGYRYAFTINNGEVKVPLKYNRSNLELPRYMITKWNRKSHLKKIVLKNSRDSINTINIAKRKQTNRKIYIEKKPVKKREIVKEKISLEDKIAKLIEINNADSYQIETNHSKIDKKIASPYFYKTDYFIENATYNIHNNMDLSYMEIKYNIGLKQISDYDVVEGEYISGKFPLFNSPSEEKENETIKKNHLHFLKNGYINITMGSYNYYSKWINLFKEKIDRIKEWIFNLF